MQVSMRLLMRSFAAATLSAGWLLSIPVANAETQSPSPGVSQQQQTPEISDQKLDAAAAALERVTSIKQDYRQRVEEAAPAEKERITNEGNEALLKAVTDQGLSPDEYTAILVVAQNDPVIRAKILERVSPSGR